jgi:hypothetical protein
MHEMTASTGKKKPLMRNLGEFFGHIIRAVKTDPAKETEKTVVRKSVEESEREDVILRRTTIEEIEVKRNGDDDDDR